jgi:hypothetical protein
MHLFSVELADVDEHSELISLLFIASVASDFISAKHTHCFKLNRLHSKADDFASFPKYV